MARATTSVRRLNDDTPGTEAQLEARADQTARHWRESSAETREAMMNAVVHTEGMSLTQKAILYDTIRDRREKEEDDGS